MTNINYGLIDETYPVAGQDNNSQGFRGNFAAIKTSLALAEEAITMLEDTTAKTDSNNNFQGNTISNAVVNKLYGQTHQLADINSPQFIDVSLGQLHYIKFAGNTTVTFKNWPDSGVFASVKVHLYSDGTQRTATLATEVTNVFAPGSDITLVGPAPTFVLNANGKHKVIEAWTYSGTSKIFLRYLGEF
jgi:hypothetical protein